MARAFAAMTDLLLLCGSTQAHMREVETQQQGRHSIWNWAMGDECGQCTLASASLLWRNLQAQSLLSNGSLLSSYLFSLGFRCHVSALTNAQQFSQHDARLRTCLWSCV
jgi:hypothetical protein